MNSVDDNKTMSMTKIKNAYTPLKKTDKPVENVKIDLNDFNSLKQFFLKKDKKENFEVMNITQLEQTPFQIKINDNVTTRIFIGGVSLMAIYVLHNLLYKV